MAHSHPHSDHHHESEHGSGFIVRPVINGASLLKASALSRLAGAIMLLVPLWIVVYWVIRS